MGDPGMALVIVTNYDGVLSPGRIIALFAFIFPVGLPRFGMRE